MIFHVHIYFKHNVVSFGNLTKKKLQQLTIILIINLKKLNKNTSLRHAFKFLNVLLRL